MKRLTTLTLLSLVALAAHARDPGGMSEADMQTMMQGMQEMQACMERIDQTALEQLSRDGEQMNKDIKTLCTEGRRDAAQARAMEYGRKIAKDPAMQAMAECGKKMQGVIPQMQQSMAAPTAEELENRHVCDM